MSDIHVDGNRVVIECAGHETALRTAAGLSQVSVNPLKAQAERITELEAKLKTYKRASGYWWCAYFTVQGLQPPFPQSSDAREKAALDEMRDLFLENTCYEAEIRRMKPVVTAAVEWQAGTMHDGELTHERLIRAVLKYRREVEGR